MRRIRWGLVAVGVSLTVGACTDNLRPGYCDQTSDCQHMPAYANDVCNLDPTPQGGGQCVPACSSVSDCQPGHICDFDAHGVGRCLLPTGPMDGGGVDAPDGGMTDGGGGDGGGDAGPDVGSCSACGGGTPLCLMGTCVQCVTSADCSSATKPICDPTAHTCGPCTSDSQCTGGPGICMSHQDGHCATDVEALYVQNVTGCVSSFRSMQGDGSSSTPYCSMDPLAIPLTGAKTLIVVRGTVAGPTWSYQGGGGQTLASVIGQQSALIQSSTSPGWNMNSGSVYIRNVKFSPSGSVGIKATGGSLRLQSVTVDSCQGGGILLDGAAFDIENTSVTRNGPGQQPTVWGGILVNSLPASGSKLLKLVTVQNNLATGVLCSAGSAIQGDGVLASGNSSLDVTTSCNITPCSPAASGTCGASP